MIAYVRVVESGSFSAAARQLGLGQPAISKTIAQLEPRLQVRLLLRSTHGLSPTEAGQRFYERACIAIQEAEEAELEARGAGAGLSGRLRISAAPTFARLHVIPRLPEFLTQHPDLTIDIILDDRVIDPIGEGVDVSFRMGALDDSHAVARKIATSGRSVLATTDYIARAGRPQLPSDLAAHEAVVYSRTATIWRFRNSHSEGSVEVDGRVRVSAAEGLRAAVLANMGLAIASDWMFLPELASGEVRRLPEDWELPGIDLWAVFPTGRLATAKARRFADFVQRVVQTQRWS